VAASQFPLGWTLKATFAKTRQVKKIVAFSYCTNHEKAGLAAVSAAYAQL